jgi:hypothetical protein
LANKSIYWSSPSLANKSEQYYKATQDQEPDIALHTDFCLSVTSIALDTIMITGSSPGNCGQHNFGDEMRDIEQWRSLAGLPNGAIPDPANLDPLEQQFWRVVFADFVLHERDSDELRRINALDLALIAHWWNRLTKS